MNLSKVLGILSGIVAGFAVVVAHAQCVVPNTLANGQQADASKVMGNFNALNNCINGAPAGSANAVQVNGGSGTFAGVGPLTNGQLIIGSTGAPPQPATLTAGSNIIITNGPGSITIAATGGGGGGYVRPNGSSMTWVNQSTASYTDFTGGPLVLVNSASTGGNNINGLVKNVAGASWTVNSQMIIQNHSGGTNLDLAGLCLYDGSSRLYIFGLAGGSVAVWQYNSPTSWNAGVASKSSIVGNAPVWYKVQYVSSATTLTFSVSYDGFYYQTVFATSAPFFTPQQYGLCVGGQNYAAGYVVSLLNFIESNP